MIYKKLSQQYTSEELADAFVFPINLTPSQKKQASDQLAAARKKGQKEMNENDRLSLHLFQLKFQLEDYIQDKELNQR